MEFENTQWDNIEKCISATIKRNLNRGGLSVSSTKKKSLQALDFRIADSLCIRRVKTEAGFYETEFTTTKMT